MHYEKEITLDKLRGLSGCSIPNLRYLAYFADHPGADVRRTAKDFQFTETGVASTTSRMEMEGWITRERKFRENPNRRGVRNLAYYEIRLTDKGWTFLHRLLRLPEWTSEVEIIESA